LRRALVTGSAGFVGRHLIPKLERNGYEVTGWDKKTGHPAELLLPHSISTYDLVVHLAANIPDVAARMKGGVEAYEDIALDIAVAKYVQRCPPKVFAWPTSCAVDNPDDPYAYVKLTGEKIFGKLHEQGIRTVMFRPFSGYGEDQALSYPFPAIIQRAVAGEDPLTVWGSGLQVRDFIHIDDLTDAMMLGIERFPSGVPVDIGTGVGTDFFRLARLVAESVPYYPYLASKNDKPASSMWRVANTAVAQYYGFKAKISIEEGVNRAVRAAKNKRQTDSSV
jgi:nucleoside-diphosphate-sugar epimerase